MKLKEFKVNSGGKFNPNAPVVIDFSQSKLVSATGDQGTGKTTLLELFLMACGQLGGEKVIEQLKNKDNDKIDIELSFVGNDRATYEVKVTKSQFKLIRDGEELKSPKDLLKSLLGVVGVSPMEIKNGSIDEIVKWLSSYSTRSAEEFEKDMVKLKEGIKKAKSGRAAANKEAKGIRVYLNNEGYADEKGELIEKAWTAAEKEYSEKPDIDELSRKLTAAGNKSDKFVENQTKTDAQRQRKAQIEAELKRLNKELDEVGNNISLGEKWLKANENAKKEYDTIKKQYDTSAQNLAAYNKWQEVQTKKADLDGYEDMAQKADAKEKEFLKEQQELQWEVIPDIKDVEILLEDTHEDEGEQRKAGFYYKGLNSRQLSASEWFGLILQIWKKNKIKVMVLDDASTLGSKFMDTLDKLVKDGCYVLMTEMARNQQSLEIDYK